MKHFGQTVLLFRMNKILVLFLFGAFAHLLFTTWVLWAKEAYFMAALTGMGAFILFSVAGLMRGTIILSTDAVTYSTPFCTTRHIPFATVTHAAMLNAEQLRAKVRCKLWAYYWGGKYNGLFLTNSGKAYIIGGQSPFIHIVCPQGQFYFSVSETSNDWTVVAQKLAGPFPQKEGKKK